MEVVTDLLQIQIIQLLKRYKINKSVISKYIKYNIKKDLDK